MKLVQKPLTALIKVLCGLTALIPGAALHAGESPPYLANYNPEHGFRPAQLNLTEIFLQLAGSLEHHGSPEPYLRHMQAEHSRIAAKYKEKTVRDLEHAWPAHMTDAYINQGVENWNLLSDKLPLAELARKAGNCARNAICRANGRETMLVEVFNLHQSEVMKTMRGKGERGTFSNLKSVLSAALGFMPMEHLISAQVQREDALSAEEKQEYAILLACERFTKTEFGQLERFYSGPYDKLSEAGKGEISKRTWDGVRRKPRDDGRQEAILSTQEFLEVKTALFGRLNSALSPQAAQKFAAIIDSTFIDLGHLAQAELELAILDSALQ